MDDKKLRVGFVTSSLLLKTGFSNNARRLLPFLYKTGKYELFHLNQGFPDGHLDFQRFPWHNEGVLKKGSFDEGRYNSPAEEGYRRHVSYGNCAIKDFIIRNKLDVVIHIEDIWSSSPDAYFKSDWWPYFKNNFLQWSTADSEPILPQFKEWAENCPSMWFWSSFAEKALKAENLQKYGHTKTVPGCIDKNEYLPILKHEKLELRKKFNIDPETIIFFQLGRNQLRKLYPFTIDSFAKFKKRNPNIKSKLFFHCSWAEPGWPLERMVKEAGLSNQDVLTTYFCQNCGQWEIKPFEGEFKNCRFCKTEGIPPNQQNQRGNGQVTAGITSAISNQDMAKIYGIADAVCSVFTSGGLEYTNLEALLCEQPLLCTDYSCGEDFTAQDFIFKLDGNYTFESGTGFKKHVPNINTIIKFMEKICGMSYEERKKIGKQGREWVSKEFSVEKVGGKIIEFIDSCKKIDWTKIDLTPKPKNPNATIVDIEDDEKWLKSLYHNILCREADTEGLNNWKKTLSQPGDKNKIKNDIVNFFRTQAQTENQSLIKTNFEDLLNKNDNKRILVVMPRSIGDIFIVTSLFESIRNRYPRPEWTFYFACEPQYHEILDGNQYIDKILPFLPQMEDTLLMEGVNNHKGFFDIVYKPFLSTQRNHTFSHNGIDRLDVKLKEETN